MNLLELYNSNRKKYITDKETVHCYLSQTYQYLFADKKANKILEIGVYNCGSILLWKDFFENSQIYGIDIYKNEYLLIDDRFAFFQEDAYSENALSIIGNDFDIIIEDGAHTLHSMIFTIKNYTNLLAKNGILIIEDVQSYDWFDILIENIPDKKFKYEIIDLRSVKNRYDDMLLVIKNDINE
jgi:hypothetical protein